MVNHQRWEFDEARLEAVALPISRLGHQRSGFVPVSKKGCRGNPGYSFFGFKNRGAYGSFVAAKGKNQRGKNQR